MKQFDVIIITAHPDDAFIAAGGLILKLRLRGFTPLIVTVTDGENQSDNKEIRTQEFINSIKMYGISGEQLHLPDGRLQFHIDSICDKIFKLLKDNNPKIIITHSNSDSHSDHRAVAEATGHVTESLFHSLQQNCCLKYLMAFAPIRLNIETTRDFTPMILCDVSVFYETKKAAILLHNSQMPYLKTNLKKHLALNHFYGSLISCEYAEGYTYKTFSSIVTIDPFLKTL